MNGEEDSTTNGEEDNIENRSQEEKEQIQIEIANSKARKMERELRKLQTYYNPTLDMKTQPSEFTDEHGNKAEKHVNFNFMTVYTSSVEDGNPETVEKALTGRESENWKQGIAQEVMNFIKRKCWKKVHRSVPYNLGKKIMKTKTIFKKKIEPDKTTRYKVRMCSKGFLMQPGVDFKQSYSPVGVETSTHVLIGIYLHNADNSDPDKRFHLETIDIEAAFLEGKMENRTFVEFPDGLLQLGFITEEEKRTHCIELLKSMYGNVDAALIFFRTYRDHGNEAKSS